MILLDAGLGRARPMLIAEADRLERLAHDLRSIAGGTSPTPADLDAAPVIDNWRFGLRSSSTMIGIVEGHPRLLDGPVRTSGVWVVDLERGWARTLSRFYVLGDQRKEANHGQ